MTANTEEQAKAQTAGQPPNAKGAGVAPTGAVLRPRNRSRERRPDIHDKGLSREKTLLPALDGRFLKRPTSCTRWLSRFAFADPLSIRSTALRDQTSICGNSAKPSTKIELK